MTCEHRFHDPSRADVRRAFKACPACGERAPSTDTAPRGFIAVTCDDGAAAIINTAHIVGVFDNEREVSIAQSHGFPVKVRETYAAVLAAIKNAQQGDR